MRAAPALRSQTQWTASTQKWLDVVGSSLAMVLLTGSTVLHLMQQARRAAHDKTGR